MTVFHIVEFSSTRTVSPGVEEVSFEYEIQAENGDPVPHRFAMLNDAEILCDVLNRYQSDAGRLLGLVDARLVKGWRLSDAAIRDDRAAGGEPPVSFELCDLAGQRVIVLRFATPGEADRCAELMGKLA